MVTDGQVQRLLRELDAGMSLATAARRAGMTDKTARHYRDDRTPPSTRKKSHVPRTYRTRPDPFAAVWPMVEQRLAAEPRLLAKTLFDWLRRERPGQFLDSHRRTFERRVRQWRATHGPGKSIMFRQVHAAGDLAASDFTRMNSLNITIAGQPFDHMVYHFVLTYSNWESVTLCASESFEALSDGLQNALWELGGVPRKHRSDSLTAAVNNLSATREFQTRYRDLLAHYGVSGQRINARQAHENGDAESSRHTPVPEPEWLNRTVNVDTGCVFGGKLPAVRYPEREFVSVPARRTYCEPSRPFLTEHTPALTSQQEHDDILDAADVLGKRQVTTRLHRSVTIREENATAALEVMSRFAADPKWLIYLPPTMSPSETTREPGLLEHPAEAFAYFRNQGVPQVVCEEKHMGSRAVVLVCRDADAARKRFGVTTGESGIVYTRTGRRFFNDLDIERRLLDRLTTALGAFGFWDEFGTTWACLDCELMPWSAKAQDLLRSQYAAVGAAGSVSLRAMVAALDQTAARLSSEALAATSETTTKTRARSEAVGRFVSAYRQYCWPVESLDDFKLAPFHLLATEGKVHTERNHVWHMEALAKICGHDPKLLLATQHRRVDVTDPASERTGIEWWTELATRGGEGMVVKPLEFIVRGPKGLVQPAVKCRGREYLRIIYGPDYTADEHLGRLRNRGLAGKRSLALREFALGIEALERFVRREPLRRVHECVFGVLALESEPVDPRL